MLQEQRDLVGSRKHENYFIAKAFRLFEQVYGIENAYMQAVQTCYLELSITSNTSKCRTTREEKVILAGRLQFAEPGTAGQGGLSL